MGNVRAGTPRITVLMPVHNGEAYLREAIESILSQTFTDFELLIIDDASTDDSVAIVQSFTDSRIRLVRNRMNLGVALTLNKGIDLARGNYIARMDADDISLPRRFQAQLDRFSMSPETAVVATWVTLIDAAGNGAGVWDCDRSASTCEQIYRQLPQCNCLAHPSIMVRKEVIVRYRYRDTRIHAEDYDLWLRLAADDVRMEKVDEPLLKYRVHSASVTAFSNASAHGLRNITAKASFLLYRMGKRKWLNRFDLRVAGCLARDAGNFAIASINMKLRCFVRRSLLTVGHLFSLTASRQPNKRLFLFFPCFHTGGAERVHANIVTAVADQNPWVIFTGHSMGNQFKEQFRKNGRVLEPSAFLENPVTRIIGLGYFSSWINRTQGSRVLGSNTPFFYELLPYLNDSVECIDLIHAFGGGLEEVSLPYVNRLNHRVVITAKTLDDLKEQYAANGVDKQNFEKIALIENAVAVPAELTQRSKLDRLKVLYVGRGTAEKRVHLVGEIAKLCKSLELPIDFTLIGDVFDSIPMHCQKYCTMVGEITGDSALEKYYRKHDVLLITSRIEGFPLAIMEAMAHGVVPVSTDVGGISTHVVSGVTGFLLPSSEVEQEIVDSFVELLSRLAKTRSTLDEISEQVHLHALEHFGFDRFNQAYRQLLVGSQTQEIG